MIDHFMYAVPDLETGIRWSQDTFGVAAAPGGSHPGLGTCNALLSLGDTYLEIISPDPAQRLEGTFGGRIAALNSGGLVTWAASGDLIRIQNQLKSRGIESAGPIPTSRTTPTGARLDWSLLFPRRHAFGGLLPFFIDWQQCEHPSRTQPVGGRLVSFSLTLPDPDAYRAVIDGLVDDLVIVRGAPGMRVQVAAPTGTVTLQTTTETLVLRAFA